MNFVYITSVFALLSGVLSEPRYFDKTSYRCDEGFYTGRYTRTYTGCVSFCWYSRRCKAVTWDRRSRDCRLHDSTLADPSTPIPDPRCISADVHTSNVGPSHPCARRPCPDTHVCAPAEAASSHVCLPLDEMTTSASCLVMISTTTVTAISMAKTSLSATSSSGLTVTFVTAAPTTETVDISTSSAASAAMTTTTTIATTPDTSCYIYMGCYRDDSDRMINDVHDRSNSMTHEWCLTRCRQDNYLLAGLEHYDECLCGNSYDSVKYTAQNEGDCNTPCEGNSSQICGGPMRLSLFQCI